MKLRNLDIIDSVGIKELSVLTGCLAELENNPYIFISARLNNERVLINKAELAFFGGLADYQLFKDLKTKHAII